MRQRALILAIGALILRSVHYAPAQEAERPIPVLFDTDVGNDIDDALALGVLHALESRGECRLASVTISKDNPHCAPFVDLVNTFYGRGEIPIGVVRNGPTPDDGNYVRQVSSARDDGRARYPRDLESGRETPEATSVLRRVLESLPDGSAVIVVVGFSTNLTRLVDSTPDAISPLPGAALVAKKCRLLVMMAGMFSASDRRPEYNVYTDAEAARSVFTRWPGPIVASGFEIGQAIRYPAQSILQDYSYVAHHPLREAYVLYDRMPYDRETWDLTAVLYAVRPSHDYFGLSPHGHISVDGNNVTQFMPDPAGRHQYLMASPEQAVRVREALVQLASQPPNRAP
jgi:inosine-uridine nucleoside N-ribohydrolase